MEKDFHSGPVRSYGLLNQTSTRGQLAERKIRCQTSSSFKIDLPSYIFHFSNAESQCKIYRPVTVTPRFQASLSRIFFSRPRQPKVREKPRSL